MGPRQVARYFSVTFAMLSLCSTIYGQAAGHPVRAIREAVDEARLVTLQGNIRPEATTANDRGPVDAGFPLQHMLLQLKRSPEREGSGAKRWTWMMIDECQNSYRQRNCSKVGISIGRS